MATTANGRAYIVVRALNTEELMDMVNEAIKAGYMVVGGLSVVSPNSGQYVYCQAMVKSTTFAA